MGDAFARPVGLVAEPLTGRRTAPRLPGRTVVPYGFGVGLGAGRALPGIWEAEATMYQLGQAL